MCSVSFCAHTHICDYEHVCVNTQICVFGPVLCVLKNVCVCTGRSSIPNRRVARPFTVHSWPGLDTTCSDCNPGRHLTKVCGRSHPKVQGQAERLLVWVLGRALDGTSPPACGVVLGRDQLCHQSRHPGLECPTSASAQLSQWEKSAFVEASRRSPQICARI